MKEAALRAAEIAGGDEGLVGYLRRQARENPVPFLGLLGKIIPLQVAEHGGAVEMRWVESVVVDPAETGR